MPDVSVTKESASVAPKAVVGAIGSLVIMLALVLSVVAFAFWIHRGDVPDKGETAREAAAYAGPQLEVHPREDLAALREREDRLLHGRASLSIDAAMRTIVDRGDKAFDAWTVPIARPGKLP